jgi:small-conductance mechanosensitive channel
MSESDPMRPYRTHMLKIRPSRLTPPLKKEPAVGRLLSRAYARFASLLALLLLTLVLAGASIALHSQSAPVTPAPIAAPESARVVQFLTHTIQWYRDLSAEQQIATEPSDLIVVNDNKESAGQVVRLSFDFARADADLIAKPGTAQAQNQGGGAPSQYQGLIQMLAKLDKQAQEDQQEVITTRQKLETATGKARQQLQSQLSEIQGEVDLDNARRDVMRSMVEFVSGSGTNGLGGTSLRAQIEQLASGVPAALTTIATPKPSEPGTSATQPAQPNTTLLASPSRPEPSGIWDMTADLFGLSGKMRTIDTVARQTSALEKDSADIRAPFVNSLRDMSSRGDELAKEADTAAPAQLAQQKQQLDALTTQFKQISSVVVPLGKQAILLQVYQRSLANWRLAVRGQFMTELKGLLVRIGFLIVLLAIVMAAAEVWRRAIFRYVHEPRRRYQFLLLRRFVLWFTIAIIVAFAFASRLGSVVTFAGLLTAGVAVALQNVILSIVGYFFLIGKYGIRVGDRVQCGGVVGTVIDIGLVRFHLMELASAGSDVPTGRVVAFSNSFVFQPGAGLFKQIPGTNFLWHEITLTLSPDADYAEAKTHVLGVAETVLTDYRAEMERQLQALESTYVASGGDGFHPSVHLRFTPAGLEVTLRYPVDLQHAAEIDERIARELLKAIDRNPKLKKEGAGTPDITVKTDVVPGAA